MREQLRQINGTRTVFTGTFERFGTKTSFGYTKKTVLLRDIQDASGRVVTDHLWFNYTKGFAALDLAPGDRVRFAARVRPYVKGYRGHRDDVYDRPVERDYKLSHPTGVTKIEQKTERTLFDGHA